MGLYRELWEVKDFKKAKGIKMANINIGSLAKHHAEFTAIFSDNVVDIINVSESWLKKGSEKRLEFLEGYNSIRQDRDTDTSGGGLISFIDKRFKYNHNKYLHLNTNNKNFEMMIFELEIPRSKPIIVISCYKPPHVKYDIASEKLNTTLDQIENNVELYLVGDLNVDYKIKHGTRFNKVKLFENKNLLKQYINSTTRPKAKSYTTIDHIYSNSSHIRSVGTLQWKPADHLCTFIIRKPEKIIREKELVCTRRAKDFDHGKINNLFENENWSEFYDTSDISKKWKIMENKIVKVLDIACPVREFKRTVSREKWVTDELLALLDLRDASVKKAMRTKKDSDWELADKIRKETRSSAEKAKNEYITNLLKEYEQDPRKFWNTLSPKINNKKLKLNSDLSTINNIASKNLAKKFNTFFSKIGADLDQKMENYDPNKHPFNTQTPRNLPSFKLSKVTNEEVTKHIKNLNIHKSSEIEDVATFFLKESLLLLSDKFTYLINLSLEKGIVPESWKIGRLNPIYKGEGSKDDEGNYRPITLLPLPCKILEKIVNTQLRNFIEANNLYTENQYGFRGNLSTADAVEKVNREIIINQNMGKHVTATFLDLRKAFDVVNHNILINKLKYQYNFEDKTINWFKNYLHQRKQYTRINGECSELENITCGVPQGSILGPTLFTLYINDIENVFTSSKVFLYADDTVILSFHDDLHILSDKLNTELAYYNNWLIYNRLTVNTKKSNVMLFKGYGTKINCKRKDIILGGEKISYTHTYKYLGVHLDTRHNYDIHIKKMVKNITFRLHKLFKLRNAVTEKIALRIYKVMILPLFDYNDVVFSSGNISSLKKLDVLQNKGMRIIGRLNKRTNTNNIMNRLEILDLKKRRLYHLLQYAYKLSKNPLEIKSVKKITRFNENKKILKTLPTHSDVYVKSFDYLARTYWNKLDQTIHNFNEKAKFNSHILKNINEITKKLNL